jgi:hypothetical protein
MRPRPPEDFIDPTYRDEYRPDFIVAHDLMIWATSSFIDPEGEFSNPDHAHLEQASLGFLWTTVPNGRAMRTVVGTAELGEPMAMGKWRKARAEQQIREWFGHVPDFILTFDANYASICDDAQFCALVEHELYHCGQERDEFGAPKFRKTGMPAFAMRGHDVEEFVGIVRRYGADAAGVRAMIDAAQQPPELARASVAELCGTCMLKAA